MTLDFTKPIQTRNGDRVRIHCTDAPGRLPVIGLIGESIHRWSTEGQFYGQGADSEANLVNVPEIRFCYMNAYEHEAYPFPSRSREEADRNAKSGRIACVRVEWQEGQFDD